MFSKPVTSFEVTRSNSPVSQFPISPCSLFRCSIWPGTKVSSVERSVKTKLRNQIRWTIKRVEYFNVDAVEHLARVNAEGSTRCRNYAVPGQPSIHPYIVSIQLASRAICFWIVGSNNWPCSLFHTWPPRFGIGQDHEAIDARFQLPEDVKTIARNGTRV